MMNKKQVLYFCLSLIFIGLNVSVLFSAFWGSPSLTLSLLGISFVFGVILYFLMRFHKKEMEYRKQFREKEKE